MGSSSRFIKKSWIDHLCDAPEPSDRLGGSILAVIDAVSKGVEIVRVHDVQRAVQALKVAKELASKG